MKGTKGRKEKEKTVEDLLSFQIIGAAIEVHRTLGGHGLLESVYEEALVWELQNSGLDVKSQVCVPNLF